MLALIAAGCSSPKVPLPEESIANERKGSDTPTTRTITSGGGSLDGYTDDGRRVKVWSISWETATLEYTSDQQFGGVMKSVRGTVYQEGKVASTFVANEARADKGTSILKLVGGVVVTAQQPVRAKLFCGEMAYDGNIGVIDARKGIEVEDSNYVLRGLNHVKAKGDLTVVATPDLFEDRK